MDDYWLFLAGANGGENEPKQYENNHHRWNWNWIRYIPEFVEYDHQIFRACIHVIWHANITFIIGHHQLVNMQCSWFDNQWAKKCIWKTNNKNAIMNQVDDHWGKWNDYYLFIASFFPLHLVLRFHFWYNIYCWLFMVHGQDEQIEWDGTKWYRHCHLFASQSDREKNRRSYK